MQKKYEAQSMNSKGEVTRTTQYGTFELTEPNKKVLAAVTEFFKGPSVGSIVAAVAATVTGQAGSTSSTSGYRRW